jgi:hypothetical protein
MFEAAELNGCLHTLAEEMQPSIISRTFPRKIVPPPPFPPKLKISLRILHVVVARADSEYRNDKVRNGGSVGMHAACMPTRGGPSPAPAPVTSLASPPYRMQRELVACSCRRRSWLARRPRRFRTRCAQDTPRPPPEAKLEALYRERQQQHARERPPLPAPPMGVPAREPTRPSSLIDAEDQRLSLQGGATRHGRASARYGNTTAITSAIWTRRSDG